LLRWLICQLLSQLQKERSHRGERIQQTTGTSDRKLMKQYHDKLKAELWKRDRIKEIPKTWKEAVIRWFDEMQHKRSLIDDQWHVKWLNKYFSHLYLTEISKDLIDEIAKKREDEDVAPASVNCLLAFIRSVLRKAANKWARMM